MKTAKQLLTMTRRLAPLNHRPGALAGYLPRNHVTAHIIRGGNP